MGDISFLTTTLVVFLVIGFALVVVLAFIGRRNRGKSAAIVDFSVFSPNELDRLKGKGLLSEEEAKRVQAIVADRTMEALKRQEAPPEERLDPNVLLAETERLRQESQSKGSSGGEEAG